MKHTPVSISRRVAAFAVAGALSGVALMLSGCLMGSHEMIDFNEECISCHSEKETYDDAQPADAVECATTLEVSTSEDVVYVCEPVFISEDGGKFVPRKSTQARATDGKATLELEEGFWVLCTGELGKSAQKLIKVAEGGQATTLSL